MYKIKDFLGFHGLDYSLIIIALGSESDYLGKCSINKEL